MTRISLRCPPSDEASSGLETQLAFSQHPVSRRSCSQRRLLSESQFPKAPPGVTEVMARKFVPRRPKTSPALRSWHGAFPKSMPKDTAGKTRCSIMWDVLHTHREEPHRN